MGQLCVDTIPVDIMYPNHTPTPETDEFTNQLSIMLSTLMCITYMYMYKFNSCVVVSEGSRLKLKESGQLCSCVHCIQPQKWIEVSRGFS